MAEEQRQDGVFDFHRLYAVDFWRDSILSRRSSLTQDEEELVEAVKQIARENAAVQRQKKMDSKGKAHLVEELFEQKGEGEGTFMQKLGQLLNAMGDPDHWLPEVTIEYRGLTVEADALVGAASNPSVLNSAKAAFKKLTCLGGPPTKRITILHGINGVLKPGVITLLLGPPGGGKSVFLQALSGRLKPSHRLSIGGSIKYNGTDFHDFVVRRTAGLVDQYDFHIPELTVLETVQFAADCMLSRPRVEEFVATVQRASERLQQEKRRHQHSVHQAAMAEEGASGAEAEGGAGAEEANGSGAAAQDGERLSIDQFDEEFVRLLSRGVGNGIKPFITLHVLGLQDVAHTIVGDQMTRGVSGGQRKRVTTAEVLVGPQNVLLCDEISTGLDSATTYSIIQSFRQTVHLLRKTFLVSLLQPPPEVFHLFDDILLLTDGRVMYHGPVGEVLAHFRSLGYACPIRKDPGSFLQEVSTPAGQLAYATPEQLASKGLTEEDRAPAKLLAKPPTQLLTPVEELCDAFWSGSEWGKGQVRQLEQQPFDPSTGSRSALTKQRYANGWFKLMKLTLKRQLALNVQMRAFHMARTIQTIVMGLITASLFATISVSAEEGRNVLSYSMLNVAFCATMTMPQIGMVFSTKRVFYKQRDSNFFGASQYVAAMLVTQLPMSATESVIYSLIVYFIVGLYRSAGYYFTYLCVYYSASNCLAGLYRLIAYSVPSMVVANAGGALALLFLIISNGFSIVRTSIPPYLIWVYWINPLAWTVRAFGINELTSPQWAVPAYPGATETLGVYTLEAFGFFTSRAYIWGAVGMLWGTLLVLSLLGALALRFTNPPKPQPSVSEEQQKEEVVRGVLGRLGGHAVGEVRRIATMRRNIAPDSATPGSSAPPSVAADADAPAARPAAAAPQSPAATAPGDGEDTRAVALPFTPITLVCRDLRYYVADPSGGTAPGVVKDSADKVIEGKLCLLQGINLHAEPSELIALMGGSGAGKTTLMDCILGRKTVGLIRGDIFVNGHPKQQETWSRVAGYVEQADVHSSKATVRESLLFSARLRLEESIPRAKVAQVVEETLDLVELRPLADHVVGDLGGEGLSIEQRKRLSIAVELVANPSVMFLDEPTSGLDARAAAIVMRAVANVAASNRTVMVVIHQPSIEIFEQFTSLVLLQRGGLLTYFGPLGFESCDLIAYLEAQPGVHTISPGYNPATWMLEVTGGSMSTSFKPSDADFPALYTANQLRAANEARGEALVAEGKTAFQPLKLQGRYATSQATQRSALMSKWWKLYARMPDYNWVRLSMTVLIALIYGIMYLNQGKISAPATVADVQNITGLIFSMTVFLGMFNCMTVQPVMAAERLVFYRERAASMYAPIPFAIATGVVEIPYLILQSGLMVVITYWMVGFQAVAWKFFYFYLTYFMGLAMFTYLGQLLVFATPNQLVGQLLAAAANQLWTMFNGFLQPYPLMPAGWKWMNRISPTTWLLEGLACSQLCDLDIPMTGFGATTTVSEFMNSYFGWQMSMIWWSTLIVFAFLLTFRMLATLALAYINFQKR